MDKAGPDAEKILQQTGIIRGKFHCFKSQELREEVYGAYFNSEQQQMRSNKLTSKAKDKILESVKVQSAAKEAVKEYYMQIITI